MFGHFTTFIMDERVNDLYNLNILLCECKMNFTIGSLTCVKYIEKQPIQARQPLPLYVGNNVQYQILKRGVSEKNECLGGLKAWGAYCVSCQKKIEK